MTHFPEWIGRQNETLLRSWMLLLSKPIPSAIHIWQLWQLVVAKNACGRFFQFLQSRVSCFSPIREKLGQEPMQRLFRDVRFERKCVDKTVCSESVLPPKGIIIFPKLEKWSKWLDLHCWSSVFVTFLQIYIRNLFSSRETNMVKFCCLDHVLPELCARLGYLVFLIGHSFHLIFAFQTGCLKLVCKKFLTCKKKIGSKTRNENIVLSLGFKKEVFLTVLHRDNRTRIDPVQFNQLWCVTRISGGWEPGMLLPMKHDAHLVPFGAFSVISWLVLGGATESRATYNWLRSSLWSLLSFLSWTDLSNLFGHGWSRTWTWKATLFCLNLSD